VHVVCEALQDGACQTLEPEDLGRFVEWQVRGDHDRLALAMLRDDLEQLLGACLAERDEAQFVDDQQVLAGEELLRTLATLVDSLNEFMDESGGRGKADLAPVLVGGQPKAEGNMCLAGPAWAQGDDGECSIFFVLSIRSVLA